MALQEPIAYKVLQGKQVLLALQDRLYMIPCT